MKQLNEEGLELIDGRPIEIYEGKIVNAFEMEQEDAVGLSDGDLITIVATVRVETPKFISIKKSGQMKRQNQMRLIEQFVLDSDKAKVLLDNLDSVILQNPVTVTQIGTPANLGFNPADLELPKSDVIQLKSYGETA